MTRLLGAFRRERNGLVADTMHYDGARYGLNYGVSLTTVRRLVRELEPQRDGAFARFLLSQQVRCLQLAAYALVEPEALSDEAEREVWFASLKNSELAEEAAYALLSRSAARLFPVSASVWVSQGLFSLCERQVLPTLRPSPPRFILRHSVTARL